MTDKPFQQIIPDVENNPIITTDFYNGTQHLMMKNHNRGVAHVYNRTKPMFVFGFNWTILNKLTRKITAEHVVEAEQLWKAMGNPKDFFPTDVFMNVVKDFHGYMPLEVKAVPDGTYIPKGTPFVEIRNSAKGFEELVYWIEAELQHAHFASGCATEALEIAANLQRRGLLQKNPFKVIDFGYRGANSNIDSWFAGLAFLLFFKGSDTMVAARTAVKEGVPVESIPAQSHRIVAQWEDEFACMVNTIDQVSAKGGKAASLIIDTYDAFHFINNYLGDLLCYARKLVNPVYPVWRIDSGTTQEKLEQSDLIFKVAEEDGYTKKDNVFGVLIGDQMNKAEIEYFDLALDARGLPTERFTYGLGSGFYENIHRETHGLAMKNSFSDGRPRMKISNSRVKRSLPGSPVTGGFVLRRDIFNPTISPGYFFEIPMIVEHKDKPTGAHTSMNGKWFEVGDGGIYMSVYLWHEDIHGQPIISLQKYKEIYLQAQKILERIGTRRLQDALPQDIIVGKDIQNVSFQILSEKFGVEKATRML